MWRDFVVRMFMSVRLIGKDHFESFVNDAQPRLWRAFAATRGPDGADEAASEALAWAWENRQRLEEMENPIGYLYRVGLTRSSEKRQILLPPPENLGLPDIEPGLIPALLTLPMGQRTAVWLYHGCGWSYAEVGEALDVTRSTVGTHMSRGMAALRTALAVTDDVEVCND